MLTSTKSRFESYPVCITDILGYFMDCTGQSLFKSFCCEKMLSGSLYGNICQLIAYNLSILYCIQNKTVHHQ